MRISKIMNFLLTLMALTVGCAAIADTYTYDSLNRLTAVAYTGGGGQTYTYDAAGNLVSLGSTPPVAGSYTLAVNLTGNGTGSVGGSGINCGSTCTVSLASGASATLTASPAVGSTFSGWSGACTGTGSCVVSLTGPKNVTALFATSATVSYALSVSRLGAGSGTVTSSVGGIACGTTCSTSLSSGTSVMLTATPAVGSSFTGWTGDCTGPSCVLNMTADQTASATFALATAGGTVSYPLVLAQGWTLLGNSLNQTLNVATLFGNPTVVNSVWKWDASISPPGWQFYTPSLDTAALQAYTTGKGYGVLSVINPGEGYWINAKVPATLATQTGPAFILGQGNLVTGWNLVATGSDVTPSAFNLSLSIAPPTPGTTPNNVNTLWAWDNASSKWYFYAPSLEANGGLAAYLTSKDYLNFTLGGKTLGNGAGFWVNKP